MTPRFHCAIALAPDASLSLPPGAARHVQVLRMQPGDAITLFDGQGGEYAAKVERMSRSEVEVQIGAHSNIEREAARAVHLAVGMPANERMDWLVEKATELGVASIQPLMTAHGVLRLSGERAEKKRAHWEAIAIAGYALWPPRGTRRLMQCVVFGTAMTASARGETMDDLAARVASPQGTTMAGLAVIDRDSALDRLIEDTFAAADRREAELAKAARRG